LGPADNTLFEGADEAHYEYPVESRWGTLCALPHPLVAYRNTAPGGDTPPESSISVEVSGFADPWQEQIDLIESESDATHFLVETNEYGLSFVRFGNNVNGRALANNAEVTCCYQIGGGSRGNIGPDSLTGFDSSVSGYPDVQEVWNPLDVTDGRDPEPAAEIMRRAPQAFRARQLRAITLEDYARRAQELPEVSHAFARYGWTGSWRTVRVAIDPDDTNILSETLRAKIAGHLDAVRLIGEDLEIRGARYVPLDVLLKICAHPEYWPEDLAFELVTEFSNGYTADGRLGFFHPDLWTFSQPLHASQLMGRAMSVTGVDRILLVSVRRWHPGSGRADSVISIDPEDLPVNEIDTLDVEANEIIQVENDPSQLEKGRIQFDIIGGRQ
jgi:predicted phage baseplate assembly protein